MPEIKIKHIVSFSSEDKVHKAENLLKSETYRKWKSANPGEKNASVILQFEKATKINSIDIGNESSAFVEVLVGRSSDSTNDYQVLLVASSFMSPIESRNETHTNRVRMFGSDKLAQNLKEEKWDRVQVVCTQPFNKNITYGLSFIKFHSPQEKNSEQTEEGEIKTATTTLGAFKIKYDDEDNDSPPSIGSWLERKKNVVASSLVKTDVNKSPSYASSVLASSLSPKTAQSGNVSPKITQNSLKRKLNDTELDKDKTFKKEFTRVNKEKIGYKDVLSSKNSTVTTSTSSKDEKFGPKDIFGINAKTPQNNKTPNKTSTLSSASSSTSANAKSKPSFSQLMKGVVFTISGFVNPLRSEIRDKALEMGAKYKGDWDSSCTHLICAFVNTPKYIQVKGENGKIVTKDWIIDCHKKRTLLPWRKYMLGRYSRDSSESSDSEEEETKSRVTKIKVNGTKMKNLTDSPPPATKSDDKQLKTSKIPQASTKGDNKKLHSSKDFTNHTIAAQPSDDETEDEEALQDYLADTDIGDDTGGDTEEEIQNVENQNKDKLKIEINSDAETDVSDDDSSLLQKKPDTSALPLPELPNLFKLKRFFLYGDFSSSVHDALKRLIISYNGVLEDYMSDSVKYVISESHWDKNFDEALAENEDLIFVKPEWIWKCHEKEKLVPYQPYIIIPES